MTDREMSDEEFPKAVTASAAEGQLDIAANPDLTEDLALALLKNPDLHPEVLERLAKNSHALKSRKVRLAVVSHPHTPRHVSVPLARQLYTFDLMKVALAPGVPADVKVAIDDVLIARLSTVALGERLTLARRASGRVAAALLLDVGAKGKGAALDAGNRKNDQKDRQKKSAEIEARETRVVQIALDNPRLTEALVISSVLRPIAGAALVQAVARHPKWSPRREVRAALLRTEHLSLACALEFSQEILGAALAELLSSSRLPEKIKDVLLRRDRE